MKHTLGELYNMKHRQEKSLQDNEYDIVRAERKVVEKKKEREEILRGLAVTNELIRQEEANEK
ncbi:hypothetical protein CN978_29765 [Priestia megaterium]|uniref:hypothetical protein n=1 Tax=Priestia megaterium TaxID=1404 RepID=UPI000BFDAAB2|nr:hypothetical protein [Priestia megaterium]PGN53894.1 hypothetical protein CN978_29765 [Priestia megaterium]